MRLKNIVKFLILFLMASTSIDAQYYSFGQHYNYAEESFENGDYLLAMEHYDKALAIKDNVKKEFIYNYAEAAYKTYSLNLAEQLYKQYLEFDDATDQSEALFKIAEIRQLQGRYEEAILDYNIYLSEYADLDSNRTKQIQFLKSSSQWAIDANIKSRVDSLQRLPDSINTKFSEYAPFEYNDVLYYNSLKLPKEIGKKTYYHSRLFNQFGELVIPGLEAKKLISHPSFSPDGKFLFYTVGDYEKYDDISCDIYYSFMSEEGVIGEGRMLGPLVNATGGTSTHPMVAGKDSSYVLYFASDRVGGKGGMDIYAVDLSRDLEASNFRNIRAINTERDEMSPFYNFRTNRLFFSSNGREGYGGFDVYSTNDLENPNAKIENGGKIINSPNNDLFYFETENGSTIYLSSNRPGSNYLEAKYETCCYDIYKGEINECSIDLLALTFDAATNGKLDGCQLKLIDFENDSILFDQIAVSNLFELDLDCEKPYKIIASKDGYENSELLIEGTDVVYGSENEITRKLYLTPSIYNLNLSVFDLDSKLPLDSLDFTLKDVETGEVTEINKHPSNKYTFPIKPGHEYELTVGRRGYTEKIEKNIKSLVDPLDLDVFIKEIEIIRKAKISLANAIPVALYFDHDQPGNGSMETTSPENFTSSYYKFFNKRANYVSKYTNRYRGIKKEDALYEINNFFSGEVKRGFDKYETFKNQLILVLESGQKVNIYLRGYTSPIAPSAYNIALGKRRIDSVRREFDEWGGGALLPYIRSGQLTITERSFGEETSPISISDDPSKPNLSIYSPQASRERRVEIDEINFNQDK